MIYLTKLINDKPDELMRRPIETAYTLCNVRYN